VTDNVLSHHNGAVDYHVDGDGQTAEAHVLKDLSQPGAGLNAYDTSLCGDDHRDRTNKRTRQYSIELDEKTLLPAEYHSAPAIQAGGGRVLTSESSVVSLIGVTGDFAPMYDFMMQLVFDLSSLSHPDVQSIVGSDTIKVSENVRLPELAGQNPMGLFCGAIGRDMLSQPLTSGPTAGPASGSFPSTMCCKNHGDQFAMPYRYCENDVLTDECESMGDMARQGCTICVEDLSDPASFLSGEPQCELMEANPGSCFTIINGIDYDVDSDDDGVNDSWSALFGFETPRIRIFDVYTLSIRSTQ